MLGASGSLIMSLWKWVGACVSIQILGPQVRLHRGARECAGCEERCLPGLRLVCGLWCPMELPVPDGKGRKSE